MREIILAEHAGFCFGVREAIRKAEETAEAEREHDGRIYTYGPLIHNALVIADLEAKGIHALEDLNDTRAGDVVIGRSHGSGPAFYREAAARGLRVVDATCPFVERIHRLAKEAAAAGRRVVIIGDPAHPEVEATREWAGPDACVIPDLASAQAFAGDHATVLCQTTAVAEQAEAIMELLRTKGEDVVCHNTICQATMQRQNACRALAARVDAMVVIGDARSANSRKLAEIAAAVCPKTIFLDKIEKLSLKELDGCNTIGVAAGASTPERIIKEVIAAMSEFTETDGLQMEEENPMHALMDEIEKSLRLPGRGEIVEGTVVQVSPREVVVNLSCKKDGILPKDEVTLEGEQGLEDLFKEGDQIQAKVLKTDDGDGNILLSKKKLDVNEHWDEINAALDNKEVVNAKVVKEVKGGVIAVYKEVSGFIPMSQLSDHYVEKADEFIGQVLPVKVSRVDQKRNKAVFSHKAYLAEEKQKKVKEIWDSLQVGDNVEGTVMRFTDYGAFVDIGGIDGLLHISEISWGKLKHPQEVLQIGQKITVRILSMNAEKGKISLGLKQNTPEPWSIIDEKYQVGEVIEGKVVQIKEYGAFVELEPGLDGLVHISEIAHKRVTNIADEISVGQVVKAKILDIDKDRKRISLSIKETLEEAPLMGDAPAEEAAPAEAPAEEAPAEEAPADAE